MPDIPDEALVTARRDTAAAGVSRGAAQPRDATPRQALVPSNRQQILREVVAQGGQIPYWHGRYPMEVLDWGLEADPLWTHSTAPNDRVVEMSRDASRGTYLCETCWDAMTDQVVPGSLTATGLDEARCAGCQTPPHEL